RPECFGIPLGPIYEKPLSFPGVLRAHPLLRRISRRATAPDGAKLRSAKTSGHYRRGLATVDGARRPGCSTAEGVVQEPRLTRGAARWALEGAPATPGPRAGNCLADRP